MRRHRVKALLGFGVTAVGLLAVVSWLTTVLVRLDRDERHARQQAAVHERLRLGLWRMDSWLSPQLAREAMRPPAEFRAFPVAQSAWTRGFTKLAPDAVVTESPLLRSGSLLFPLHFELDGDVLKSPQVPLGNERDVAEASGVDKTALDRAAARLQQLAPVLTRAALEPKVQGAEAQLPMLGCIVVAPEVPQQTRQSLAEFNNRQRSFAQNVAQQETSKQWVETVENPPQVPVQVPVQISVQPQAQQAEAPAATNRVALVLPDAGQPPIQPQANLALQTSPPPEVVGPLVPVWLDGGPEPVLVFARRVQSGAASRFQGVVADWPQLQRELLALVADLFPPEQSRLVRCEAPAAAEQPSMLASVPARLSAQPDDGLTSGLPLPWMLATTWGVTLLGLAVLWFTLRAALGYGERRARFASAVTHELRTPLTTFRMYSEMLADGVVQGETAQREYLTTLQRESDRLSRVVENVLAWSRLEEGRFASRRERVGVGAMVERLVPTLERRLGEAGLRLEVQVDAAAGGTVLVTDEDAVGQVLFNLVDNAAKYGRGGGEPRVELRVTAAAAGLGSKAGAVCFAVHDRGPGIPGPVRERIFAPFDRGAQPSSSNDVPGVGLGLALARGLARDLGGDLRLDAAVTDGACFVLELPA
ncbi:MAG: HAMP domain-containing histidine kinase [Planctomycetes bacterium]|nr:HAMP domain-containing histidine kinase [Planctomycetota bacterium]